MASPHQTRHGRIRGEAPHTDQGGPGKTKGVGWCPRQSWSLPMARIAPGPASLGLASTATSMPMADGSNAEECHSQFRWTTTTRPPLWPSGKASRTADPGSSSSAFPSYISGVNHFGWDFVYVTILNPTIEVVTVRLRGWCMLGVFLLPALTRPGHDCQDLLSPCDGMYVSSD